MAANTKVITGKCRLSYAHIFTPKAINGEGPEKYSASVIIPKSDTVTLKKISDAINAAIQDGITSKWGGKKPRNLKTPLRDGDEEHSDDPAYKGCMFLNANSNRKPGVVDINRQPLYDDEDVYSGCYCRFSLGFFPFAVSGNAGVAVGLNNIQKICDGERLGGAASAEDDFSDDYKDPDAPAGVPDYSAYSDIL